LKDPKTVFGSLVSGGDWPYTVSKNASGASASDGTPFCADLIDIDWGWIKRIMYLASLTPSGVADDYSSSQVVNAIRRAGMQPGLFVYSALNATKLALCRFLPLTGQIILMSSYSELCAAVYVGDTANPSAGAFYKCTAAGVRDTTGLYMKMPDAQGAFLRGIGTNGTLLMANGSGYNGGTYPGDSMLDAIFGHYHTMGGSGTGTNTASLIWSYTSANSNGAFMATGPIPDGIHGTPRIGYENRPVSIGAQICIAY